MLLCGVAAAAGASEYRWQDVPRVVAFGDVHGAYEEFVRLLRATGIVDDALKWSGGQTHLVSLGDLLDRGADSRRVLDLLMRLEQQAMAAGGRVHVVLGNHEMMNMAGDLRYVAAGEYAAFAGEDETAARDSAWQRFRTGFPAETDARAAFDAAFPAGYFAHRAAFSATGKYGRWLLDRPLLIVVNDTAFTHGGLPPLTATLGLDAINETLRAQLRDFLVEWQKLIGAGIVAPEQAAGDAAIELQKLFAADPAPVLDPAIEASALRFVELSQSPVFDDTGPLWYRGSSLCPVLLEQDLLTTALESLDAQRLVVGHSPTPTRRVTSRFGGRVIVADTGMLTSYYRGTPAAVEITAAQVRIHYPDLAESGALPLDDAGNASGWHGGANALAEFLSNAPIVASSPGVRDGEHWVTLRDDDREATAVSFSRRAAHNELAAYRLDRLLGLGLVPVTVPREMDGRSRALQWRGDDWIDERTRIQQQRPVMGWCAEGNAFDLQYAFDALTHNQGRSAETMFYSDGGNKLWLSSFGDAFGTRATLPDYLQDYSERLVLPAALARKLSAITPEALKEALGDALGKRELGALIARRDRMLKDWTQVSPLASSQQ